MSKKRSRNDLVLQIGSLVKIVINEKDKETFLKKYLKYDGQLTKIIGTAPFTPNAYYTECTGSGWYWLNYELEVVTEFETTNIKDVL